MTTPSPRDAEAAVGHERRVRHQLAEAIRGVINSACHPAIALRAVMVDLKRPREALAASEALDKGGAT